MTGKLDMGGVGVLTTFAILKLNSSFLQGVSYNHMYFRTYSNDAWWKHCLEQLEILFLKSLSTQEYLPTQDIDYTAFFTEAVSK